MMQMITETPVYVWPLLTYLIWRGWESRKTHVTSWKALLIMPIIIFAWSIYAIFSSDCKTIWFVLWPISISLGIWFGSLTIRKLNLKFDKQQNLIETAGSWTPMILSMSIFGLRYFLGATYGFYPELKGSIGLLILENIATIISGMFIGRLIGYWRRFKSVACNGVV
jgi:hypothetical protein